MILLMMPACIVSIIDMSVERADVEVNCGVLFFFSQLFTPRRLRVFHSRFVTQSQVVAVNIILCCAETYSSTTYSLAQHLLCNQYNISTHHTNRSKVDYRFLTKFTQNSNNEDFAVIGTIVFTYVTVACSWCPIEEQTESLSLA